MTSHVRVSPKMKHVAIVMLSLALSGCWLLTGGKDDASMLLACPERVNVPADDSFGATTVTLAENAKIYYKCRCAGLPKSCKAN